MDSPSSESRYGYGQALVISERLGPLGVNSEDGEPERHWGAAVRVWWGATSPHPVLPSE